ncbi:class I SAM-dependent methyltransferase [Gammaproteobacteria bacterium]|nr:class I SAM-dependent methyltransferase [Gammaproteobacteria bacterium]
MQHSGYFTSLTYSVGYYSGLNPLHASTLNKLHGKDIGEVSTACELGFGNGLSLCMHAATSKTVWYGNDLMPEHVNFTKGLLRNAELTDHLYNEDFTRFCAREELPDFDFIALHGVWSWINDQNRSIIVDFIKRKLNPGGTLYISYNSLPGQSNLQPFRHIFKKYHESEVNKQTDAVLAISKAIERVSELLHIDPRAFKESTTVKEHVLNLKTREIGYLGHEYLNDSWEPMYFDRVNSDLKTAGLSFLSSSNFVDHIPAFSFDSKQYEYLSTIQNSTERQLAIDYITGRQFRREYWVKHEEERAQNINLADFADDTCFVQIVSDSSIKLTIKADATSISLSQAIYTPFSACFAGSETTSFSELVSQMSKHGAGREQVGEAVGIFMACGYIAVAVKKVSRECQRRTLLLNNYLIQLSLSNQDIKFLASTKIQGGLYIPRLHLLFLSVDKDKREQGKLEQTILLLESNQEVLNDDNGDILNGDDLRAEVSRQHDVFASEHLPRYRMLGIIE